MSGRRRLASLYYHVNTFKPRTDRGNWILSLHLRDLGRACLGKAAKDRRGGRGGGGGRGEGFTVFAR